MSYEPKPERVRRRTILFGLVLIYFAGLWVFGGEMGGGAVRRYTNVTAAVPFCTAVLMLFLVSLANLWLTRRHPGWSFSKLELLALYMMVTIGTALQSNDMQSILVTLMGYPTYFANLGHDWNSLFHGALPQWLMVTDRAALEGFYKGDSNFLTVKHLAAWWRPLLAWSCFIWAMLAMMMCVATILRKAWVEQERLSFPIVALPLAMAEQPTKFFTNRLMWIGFAIAGGITLFNGLHMFYPSVPYLPIRRRNFYIGPVTEFTELRIAFYFFAIALGFLMPLDLSTSVWVFYILFRAQQLTCQVYGLSTKGGFPYTDGQTFGAFVAIFATSLWGLRRHLAYVWKQAISGANDGEEPISYRRAIIGFAVTSLVMIAFARAAGMPGPVALGFFLIWLVITVVVTRLRAEFGFPMHDAYTSGPDQTLVRIFGAQAFDKGTLGAFSLFAWYNRSYTPSPMPSNLEGLRMVGSDIPARKQMFKAMAIAGAVTVPMAFYIALSGIYHFGAATANMNKWGTLAGTQLFGRLESWFVSPLPVQRGETVASLFGFAMVLGLTALRRVVPSFPLHPLGYAVANSYGMYYLACPIMVGSWCKAAITHIGGLPGVRRATMFFFGLMLGEFVIGSAWTIFGLITGIYTYDFWP